MTLYNKLFNIESNFQTSAKIPLRIFGTNIFISNEDAMIWIHLLLSS